MLRIFSSYLLKSQLLLSTLILFSTAQPHFSSPMYGPQMVMTSSGMVPLGAPNFGSPINNLQPPPPFGSSYGGIQNGANLLSPYSRSGLQGQNGQQGLPGQFGGGYGQQMGGFGGNYHIPGGMYGQFPPYSQIQGMQGQGFGHGFQGGYPNGQLGSSVMSPHSPFNAGGIHSPYNSYPSIQCIPRRRRKRLTRGEEKISRAESQLQPAAPIPIANSEEYVPEFSISLPLISFSVPEPEEKGEEHDEEEHEDEDQEKKNKETEGQDKSETKARKPVRTPKSRGIAKEALAVVEEEASLTKALVFMGIEMDTPTIKLCSHHSSLL